MEQYQSQDITKLAKALLSVQRVLQPAVKDALNPFAKNRYASLNSIMEVCREPLLDNGFQVIPQLEICIQTGQVPIKAHLDFVLVGENAIRPIIRVLELKSTANIPKSPSKSYETQIHGQTSLLHKYWNEPVFNLRDTHGILLYENKTFPEICQNYLGAVVPDFVDNIDVQGWLLCVSMNGAKTFGPYKPSSFIVDLCHKTALLEWKYMQEYQVKKDSNTILNVGHAKGFCLVCTFCEYVNSCPKFAILSNDAKIPEWEQSLDELTKLKEIKEKTLAFLDRFMLVEASYPEAKPIAN